MQLVTLGGAALWLSPPAGDRLETASRFDVRVTGPECTAAVAAARLGADATWLSRLAADPLGGRVESELEGRGVEVVADRVESRQGSHFFERGSEPRLDRRVDDRSGSAIESLSMNALPLEPVAAADVAYVSVETSTAATGLAGATAKFLKAASDAGVTTALGVLDARGLGDRAATRDTLEGLLPVVDVLVATASAVAALFDRSGDASNVMHALASEHDLETVALHGERGAATWDDSTVNEFLRPDVEVVDVTGAVDAFAGAFLVGLMADDAGVALRRAVAADALARTTTGPLAGFTATEVERVAETVERP